MADPGFNSNSNPVSRPPHMVRIESLKPVTSQEVSMSICVTIFARYLKKYIKFKIPGSTLMSKRPRNWNVMIIGHRYGIHIFFTLIFFRWLSKKLVKISEVLPDQISNHPRNRKYLKMGDQTRLNLGGTSSPSRCSAFFNWNQRPDNGIKFDPRMPKHQFSAFSRTSPPEYFSNCIRFRRQIPEQRYQRPEVVGISNAETGNYSDTFKMESSRKMTDDETKNGNYWERRRKNNEAAKRSRDSRRAKEDEVAIRAAFLEQENLKLKIELSRTRNEIAKLTCLLYNLDRELGLQQCPYWTAKLAIFRF